MTSKKKSSIKIVNTQTSEEKKQEIIKLKEKKLDYFHSLSKFTFTAIVLGAVVSVFQDTTKFSYYMIIYVVLGLIVSSILYIIGNNFLKDS